MRKKLILWCAWGLLYILCVPFSYINDPEPAQSVALLLLGLIFFLPGVLLLIDALRSKDKRTLLILRWISGLSLALTLCFLVGNVFSALGSDALGETMYGFLVLVSVPMLCCRQWALSLLLWALLFFATIVKPPKSAQK